MPANVLIALGTVLGSVGTLLCLVAGGARLAGMFHLLGFESMTGFVGGIGLMTAGCFLLLVAVVRATQS